jgi:hypothetical protein
LGAPEELEKGVGKGVAVRDAEASIVIYFPQILIHTLCSRTNASNPALLVKVEVALNGEGLRLLRDVGFLFDFGLELNLG